MNKKTISYKTTNSEVFIGNDVFALLNEYLRPYLNGQIFVLVDENTLNHCSAQVISSVENLNNAEIIEIPSGEESKSIDICYKIWKTLTDFKADRKSLLINLGGGVITDIGGFVASTFKRGIDFINIPTTLLAQIDASVGGKVGIDFEGNKNLIGVFNEPRVVFIYPNFLKTLDKRQMLSGYAEALKHALIKDEKYWKELQEGSMLADSLCWDKLISKSVEIKNKIVCSDPFENGERKLLNFGHTVGHAVESYYLAEDYLPLLHGEAVAIGIICESYLSNKMNGLSDIDLENIVQYITQFYKLTTIDSEDFHKLIDWMKNDKKNQNSRINFSILKSIGEATYNHSIEDEMIFESLNFYNQITKPIE